MSNLKLLASRNFIAVNKTLMIKLGIDEAIMIGELASEYDYWETQYQLDEEGFFYATVEKVEQNTTLTKYKQKKALDKLQKLGVVEVKRKGVPAKRYIKINEKRLFEILDNKKSKNFTSRSQKILPLEVKKFDLNNNINKNINNNSFSVEKEKKREKTENKKFTPPTVDEVKEYCDKRNNNVDPEKFVAYYSSVGWYVGNKKMKNWKSSILLWEKNNFNSQPTKDVSYDISMYETSDNDCTMLEKYLQN